MKKALSLTVLTFLFFLKIFAQETKIISDCTVSYKVSVEDSNASASIVKTMTGTSKVLYIKGTRSRSDLETPNFKQTMIYDSKSDTTIILRELGPTKYISYLDGEKRKEKNKKYSGIQFTRTNEKKTILGYECSKVVANFSDGSSYDVFYTSTITPSTTDYEYQFKDLPGLVLEYEAEFEHGKTKVKYTATKISLVPVPIAKFDVPKSGYRVL